MSYGYTLVSLSDSQPSFSAGCLSVYQLQSLQIPNHWVRWFFLAHVYQEHRMHDKVLDIYQNFIAVGFSNCNYIIAQLAITYHSMQGQPAVVCCRGVTKVFLGLRFVTHFYISSLHCFTDFHFSITGIYVWMLI